MKERIRKVMMKMEFEMKKQKYEAPVMEVIEFESADVITTSGDVGGSDVGDIF